VLDMIHGLIHACGRACGRHSPNPMKGAQVLGHTLPEIAAEKAGIFKRGAPALTVPQRPDAMQTLVVRGRARPGPESLSVLLVEQCRSDAPAPLCPAARMLSRGHDERARV